MTAIASAVRPPEQPVRLPPLTPLTEKTVDQAAKALGLTWYRGRTVPLNWPNASLEVESIRLLKTADGPRIEVRGQFSAVATKHVYGAAQHALRELGFMASTADLRVVQSTPDRRAVQAAHALQTFVDGHSRLGARNPFATVKVRAVPTSKGWGLRATLAPQQAGFTKVVHTALHQELPRLGLGWLALTVTSRRAAAT